MFEAAAVDDADSVHVLSDKKDQLSMSHVRTNENIVNLYSTLQPWCYSGFTTLSQNKLRSTLENDCRNHLAIDRMVPFFVSSQQAQLFSSHEHFNSRCSNGASSGKSQCSGRKKRFRYLRKQLY